MTEAEKKFIETLIANGRVAEKGQKLGPGQTHRIIGYADDGTPIIRRVRFGILRQGS